MFCSDSELLVPSTAHQLLGPFQKCPREIQGHQVQHIFASTCSFSAGFGCECHIGCESHMLSRFELGSKRKRRRDSDDHCLFLLQNMSEDWARNFKISQVLGQFPDPGTFSVCESLPTPRYKSLTSSKLFGGPLPARDEQGDLLHVSVALERIPRKKGAISVILFPSSPI